MFTYTGAMVKENNLPVLFETDDLYHSGLADDILKIQTFYEQQWLARGLNIKYIKFECPDRNSWTEPEIEIEKDPYRSYGRSNVLNQSTKNG
jgi:tRNA (guanine-N7-)-methyltransferase